ncbi:MAG: type II secretion system F family protein [Phycisphaerae bacterium]|nr:type II secretion system F family protein [Phycisphaerae bacterium]
MVEFAYNAVNTSGETVEGVVSAADRRSAVAELAARGLYPSGLEEKAASSGAGAAGGFMAGLQKSKLFAPRVGGKDLLAMTTQLSTALRAGLPVLKAIEILQSQQQKPAVKELLNHLGHAVSSGDSLSDAMAARPDCFSELYVSMVRVGETGGLLEKTMSQLTGLIARDVHIKSSMKNAAAYPLFVLTVGVLSVIVVLTKILPKIVETISGTKTLLPLPTRMLMGLSDFLLVYGWLAGLLLAGAIFAFVRWKKSPKGRIRWDAAKLKIPVLGSVLRTIAVGRFARMLGALTESGITILHALGIVRDTLGNEVLGREIDEVANKVRAGANVAEPLGQSGLFPPLLVQIVAMGEQTGKLDELLLNAADTFDADADEAVTRFMSVFPAFLILLLALVVGFIIAATLLPIMGMDLGGAGI